MSICESFRMVASVSVAAVAIGCNGTSGSEASTAPGESHVLIRTDDRTFTSVLPAELKVSLGAIPTFQLGVQGAADGEKWSMIALVPMDQALRGQISVALSGGAIEDGVGNLVVQSSAGMLQTAIGGVLHTTIAKGKIAGQAQASPTALAGDITGDVAVSCWIPRDIQVDEMANGTTDDANTEVLVEDGDMSSVGCQPFKTLR